MNDLLTLAQLGDYLGTTPSCTQSQLDTAVAIVRRHCRWHIAPVRTETFRRRTDGRFVWIPTLHLTGVSSIDELDLEAEGLDFDENGTIELARCFATGRVDVEVAHGWDVADVADVVGVIAQIAARISPAVTPTAAGTVAPVEETISGYSYKLPGHVSAGVSLSQVEMLILDAHQLPNHP